MSHIVAIVGRPNVGKSTLFNRLTGEKRAIVDPTAGVTRDRQYGKSDWNGIEFSVIDTGGYVIGSDDVFEKEIRKQVALAMQEADAIIFMVDVVDGLTGMDEEIALMLRKTKKPVYVVVNKVDNTARQTETPEFFKLGLGNIFPISSMNGSGTGELLDELVAGFGPGTVEVIPEIPRIAVVGRPNVGKSSMINVLLGEDRNIVTPLAGTTRDSINTRYKGFGFDLFLIDTAGLRKKQKVFEDIEFYSTLRAVRSIESSDVSLLLIDATEGIQAQDLSIFRLIEKNHKGAVIVVNKWDLVEKDTGTAKEYTKSIYEKIQPFKDVPVIYTSTISRQRIFKVLEEAVAVHERRKQRITTSKLNDLLLPVIAAFPPPSVKGKFPKIKYVSQLPVHFPAFAFFSSHHQYLKESYKRFLENKLRENFNFSGVPIEVYVREK